MKTFREPDPDLGLTTNGNDSNFSKSDLFLNNTVLGDIFFFC